MVKYNGKNICMVKFKGYHFLQQFLWWVLRCSLTQPAFMKIIGHVRHFRWLGPNVWWEISQIWIQYIKPIGQMSDEPWKFFSYTAQQPRFPLLRHPRCNCIRALKFKVQVWPTFLIGDWITNQGSTIKRKVNKTVGGLNCLRHDSRQLTDMKPKSFNSETPKLSHEMSKHMGKIVADIVVCGNFCQ